MQLVFATRGIKHFADMLINDLQAQNFPMKIIEDGKEKTIHVQGALRPVQLWEYVFPEDQYDMVMRTLGITNEKLGKDYILSNLKLNLLRKSLGIEKCPKIDEKGQVRLVRKDWVSIHPLGIKRDEIGEIGKNKTGERL